MAYSPSPNTTQSAGLAHLATVWYNRRALDQLKKRFRFYNACEPDMIPRRSGKTVQWFRYTLLGANTTPAPEGTVGNSNTLATTTVSGTVSDFVSLASLRVRGEPADLTMAVIHGGTAADVANGRRVVINSAVGGPGALRVMDATLQP